MNPQVYAWIKRHPRVWFWILRHKQLRALLPWTRCHFGSYVRLEMAEPQEELDAVSLYANRWVANRLKKYLWWDKVAEWPMATQPKDPPPLMLGRYTLEDGSIPDAPNPAYCLCEDGKPVASFTNEELTNLVFKGMGVIKAYKNKMGDVGEPPKE